MRMKFNARNIDFFYDNLFVIRAHFAKPLRLLDFLMSEALRSSKKIGTIVCICYFCLP